MQDTTIIDYTGRDTVTDPLIDFLRKEARELLQVAVKAERDAFLGQFAARRTSDGRAAVVRSGYHPERAVQTGIGPVTVKVPKVRAKDGKPVTKILNHYRCIQNFQRITILAQAFQVNGKAEKTVEFITAPPLGNIPVAVETLSKGGAASPEP